MDRAAEPSAGVRRRAVYPAGAFRTFTMTFDETWGDDVRVIGRPGGSARFTSIAELEVYYG
ncbi:hypothetical protein [Jiangella asiatica]|uniref:Uncharacterized protein n=1 Tax=Jiangella asiatica TaxID=2530372 RepID=A0A4R5CQU0_9ACTN|nr:hypothetical protein [Jiangella asiatica]TDD99982.1 hypothetical protein E1269_26940 [Jiangella asiatica]